MQNKKKIIIAVAPVSHVGKSIPSESKNPITPEEISEQVINCAKAGAGMVHLHVRDLKGEQTFDLSVFKKTLDLICAKSDIIIQGSTGGVSTLTLEERCVCLDEPRVEVASLNMGSVNFGDGVYINTIPDIKFWSAKMKVKKVLPELENFDLSMISTCIRLADGGVLNRPLHFNFCLGFENAIQSNIDNLFYFKQSMEPGSNWGFTHEGMEDFSLHAGALSMGASVLRVGFEDGFYFKKNHAAKNNVILVEKLVNLIESLGHEIATPKEAHNILRLDKLRK